ncbi:MAG: hypothetical protein JF625_18170 [Inquilinus limosus]|uniref:Uncharacterized protein n=1 Tax=Inquilinus limosus TaxID=171674 RepID=A0A952KF04_9PROT|nr:hypothetical protein [Inquilinus limosus]
MTAGTGEHQPEVRDRLRWTGAAPDSPVAVLVIPTDEEQVVANEAFRTGPER